MTSGNEVARQVGILKPVNRPQARFIASTATPSWADLVEDGSVQRLVVKAEEVGLKSDGRPYSGCYVNVSLDIYAQDNTYGRRINCNLSGVQFYRDGDSFEGGTPASPEEFEDLSDGVDDDELENDLA